MICITVYGTIVSCGSHKPVMRISRQSVYGIAPKVSQYLHQEKKKFFSELCNLTIKVCASCVKSWHEISHYRRIYNFSYF